MFCRDVLQFLYLRDKNNQLYYAGNRNDIYKQHHSFTG